MPTISLGMILFGAGARRARQRREENFTYTILVTLPDGLNITLMTTVPRDVTQQRIEDGLRQGVTIRPPLPPAPMTRAESIVLNICAIFLPSASIVVIYLSLTSIIKHFSKPYSFFNM